MNDKTTGVFPPWMRENKDTDYQQPFVSDGPPGDYEPPPVDPKNEEEGKNKPIEIDMT